MPTGHGNPPRNPQPADPWSASIYRQWWIRFSAWLIGIIEGAPDARIYTLQPQPATEILTLKPPLDQEEKFAPVISIRSYSNA